MSPAPPTMSPGPRAGSTSVTPWRTTAWTASMRGRPSSGASPRGRSSSTWGIARADDRLSQKTTAGRDGNGDLDELAAPENTDTRMSPTPKKVKLATNVSLAYVDVGPRSDNVLVLLPGLSDSWRSYELV